MQSERLQLLGVCVVFAICLPALVQGKDSVVRAKLGGVVELGCSLAPPTSDARATPLFPLHVVEWVRRDSDVPVLIKFGAYSPRVHPSYEGRVSLSHSAALLVEGIRLEDEGWFECRILRLNSTMAGSRNGTWTFLSVTAPPVFTKTPPPVLEALQGNSLALTCSAHGNPPPVITWRKDGMAAGKGEEAEVVDGTLTVVSVTRQTAGVYECQVSNTEGSLTHATQLRVKGPPAILIPPKDTALNLSQNALLRCRAEAYPPNMTYVWRRQGENVYHIDSLKSRVKILVDGTLLIPTLIPEDSGNYTCMPTNGLLTPPTASAYLTVKHPAQVMQMPQVTYLPSGMGGSIVCPVRAEPPLLSVSWTKDGQALDLNMYPGWMLTSEGSLFIAAANDDAVGTYACTAYNSYGTMGPSRPTQVVLQDAPSFKVLPREEYQQLVDTELVIPCQAHGDPSPSITWAKVGPAPRSPYMVAPNGSLVLQPLSKDHQGSWECRATNRVATVSTGIRVSVLGTSPHAVSSVSIVPGTNQANVSWVPGFDGGHSQKFTVWLKQKFRPKQKWVSFPVTPSISHLLVTGLLPGTDYQLSVLPQNKVGIGPFSEIVTVQTLVPLTDLPPAVTMVPKLAPPTSLWANQSSIGIVLKWVPPLPEGPPITGFILQSRLEGEEEWSTLDEDIGADDSEVLLQGLLKDCSYELRMLAHRDGLVGTPSQSLNVSTTGMGMPLVRTRNQERAPASHMATVLGSVGFLCAAVLLLLGAACFVSRKKRRRRRKKREDNPDTLKKCPPVKSGILTDSPDSVLKMKVCLLNSVFPKLSWSNSDLSSMDDGSCTEYQDQDRQLLSPPLLKSCLGETGDGEGAPSSSVLESISRGPDGRFIVQPHEDSNLAHNEDFPERPAGGGVSGSGRTSRWSSRKTYSLCSETDEKPDRALVLSVDLPNVSESSYSDSDSDSDSCGSVRRCPPASVNLGGTFPRRGGRDGCAGYLPRDAARELADGRALVMQMERERETGHLSRCLTLARERETLERELERCEARLSLRSWRRETGAQGGTQGEEEGDEAPAREGTQLEGRARSLDYRGGRYVEARTKGPTISSSSYAQRDDSTVSSVSSRVVERAWPPHTRWNESGARPYTSLSLPPLLHTTPDSTCLLSDDITAENCHWRAPPKEAAPWGAGVISVHEARMAAGAAEGGQERNLNFTQNTSDSAQKRLREGGGGEDDEYGVKEHKVSTLPHRRGGGRGESKTRETESMGMLPGGSSTPYFPEFEKEVDRAPLWKSDKGLFTDSSSPLTHVASDGSGNQSNLSQIFGSARTNLMPQLCEMSQLHTSPILKYLSLPGFVEMNVDEPMNEDNTGPASSGPTLGQKPRTVFPSDQKAIPKVWEVHAECERETSLNRKCAALLEESPAVHLGLSANAEPLERENHHWPAEPEAVGSCKRAESSEKRRPDSSETLHQTLRRSQSLTREVGAGQGGQKEPKDHKSLTCSQDPEIQGSRTKVLPSGRDPLPPGCGQTPPSIMNKTLRRGSSRAQSAEPVLRKSASLRSQSLEQRNSNANPVSKTSHREEFPSPEVWVRSLSLGCAPKAALSLGRGPEGQGSASAPHHQSCLSWGSPHNSGAAPTSSSLSTPLSPTMDPQRHPASVGLLSPDPRRQTSIFTEAPGWPISYLEVLSPLKPKSVAPHDSTMPLHPSNPQDSVHDPPTAFPPSWSHPGHTLLSHGEPNSEEGVEQERAGGQGVEEEMGGGKEEEEEGRGSYASQSSGRGSLGPLSQQSSSPTLPISPETLQESKVGDGRCPSVDENYEWDAADFYLESDVPKAMWTHPNQEGVSRGMKDRRSCPHPKDLDHIGEYQLSPESTCSRDPRLDHDYDTVLF
ncbi:hypothetical protein AAFF_G00251670 [Aldrovandia affinis]|uniref:Protein turtle homolog A-like n=1 Tax=Aldrovandia affinis TaxID=143900 RepID=A0AAD7SUP4_9TELE|nr:hypothetical protein AAFF_G00251670 [Aldrovandia affinis]